MRSSGQGYRQGIPVRCRLAYVGQIAAYLRLSCLSTPLHCPLAPGLPGCTSPTEVFTSWCVCLRLTICLECPAGVPGYRLDQRHQGLHQHLCLQLSFAAHAPLRQPSGSQKARGQEGLGRTGDKAKTGYAFFSGHLGGKKLVTQKQEIGGRVTMTEARAPSLVKAGRTEEADSQELSMQKRALPAFAASAVH